MKKLTLMSLTVPIFIELFLNMLMGNVDTFMMSHYSDSSVAAIGVSNQIIFVLLVMFGFIGTGASILTSQALGAKNSQKASEIAVISVGANFLFGLILSALIFIFRKEILHALNVPHEIYNNSLHYLTIVGSFMFIQAIIITMGAVLRSHGFTRDAMYVTVGMNLFHICMNAVVIFGLFGVPILGVTGTAISTSTSRFLALIAMTILLFKRIKEPLPFHKFFSMPMSHLKQLLRIGLPSAGEQLSYNLSQFLITFFITTFMGTVALTTRIYTQNIMMFTFMASIAFAEGTQILVGRYIGEKEYEKAYKRCLKSLKAVIVVSIVVSIVFNLVSKQLFGLFTHNETIITVGATLLLFSLILEPGRAFNLVVISSLRSTGDVKFPLYMGLISMWTVSVGTAYLLGVYLHLGLIGIWIAFTCDEWLRGIFMLWRWRSRRWMNNSLIQQNEKRVK